MISKQRRKYGSLDPPGQKFRGRIRTESANVGSGSAFQGSAGQVRDTVIRNLYFRAYFNETKLTRLGTGISIALIVLMYALA